MGGSGDGAGERSASEAASLVFRIATVGLSLASAIMTATSSQCLYDADDGRPAVTVSYADYPSLKYSAAADLLSAALQGVAIFLEVGGKEKAAKTVQLIDKLVQALTSTSAALLLAVDDITSCGGPTRGGGARRRRGSACGQAGGFCGRVRESSAFSLAAAVSVSASIYIRRAPAPATLVAAPPPTRRTPAPAPAPVSAPPTKPDPPPPPAPTTKEPDPEEIKTVIPSDKLPPSSPPPRDDGGGGGAQEPASKPCPPAAPAGCIEADLAPVMPPPWCRCPRLTIPCGCENPDLCGAFF
ncbi:hypothetical protein ACP70R_032603 [Stipagrostis hirtigluma subsp. patula]